MSEQAGKMAERAQFDRWIGSSGSVLVEKRTDDGRWFGRTEGYAPIQLNGRAQSGGIVSVRVTGMTDKGLRGEVSYG